ncbi:MAG TPA: primosomal protein N' [Halanaerobiales bacterium]|nr:primosomal protein N' [Halanaerobiales bacterium]
MNKFAEVIVDLPVHKFDKVYDYIIPTALEGKLKVGMAVKVRFGKRKVRAFILNIKTETEVEKDILKEIDSLISQEVFFDRSDLKLYKWISKYYCALLISVIKAAVPTAVFKGTISKKTVKKVKLKIAVKHINKELEKLKSRAPSQFKVLNYFKKNTKKEIKLNKLIRDLDVYIGAVHKLVDKDILEYNESVKRRIPYKDFEKSMVEELEPTATQKEVLNTINKNLFEDNSNTYLLHGVTGSGKTEVYMQLIKEVLNKDKGAILLVPEISLTPLMVKRFYSRFGEEIAVLHSALSTGERYDEWRNIKNGKARIVIGARSAIFAPVKNLGIIIIDEEHENSYKQGNHPYYHAREVAKKRAEINNIDLILGSATPSLESYYKAKEKNYKYLSLPQRIDNKKMPPVEIIDMTEELKQGNPSIFSNKLETSLKQTLNKGEQALLFLNRRGYSSFVLCRSCGEVIRCENCDISMTYHRNKNKLICHYCGATKDIPKYCPNCSSKYIKDFGIGTERIENEVKKLLPKADVARMDQDTTTRKGSHRKILSKLENNEIDILIGTQMVAKGHDYPNISFVGVITADTIMNLPDFRSSERTFQLLTQVAGRTGRGKKKGTVAIQTYNPEHYSVLAAKEHDYEYFYNKEIVLRKALKYPPFINLVNITITHKNKNKAEKAAKKLYNHIKDYRIKKIVGPSPAPIERIRGRYRVQLLLKFNEINNRTNVLIRIKENYLKKVSMNVKYNIDVDPISML